MNKSIECALKDWKFVRSNTIAFLQSLTDEQLSQTLPRKGLNTIKKHMQELISCQKSYIVAINSGRMSYEGVEPTHFYTGEETIESLLNTMEELDKQLFEIISETEDNKQIIWFDQVSRDIASHISNMSIHESLHIGQFIAFCYVLNIPLPKEVVHNWVLD